MNLRKLVLRNVLFYRRPYLAVLAGVMVSTAVLTGALLVGDSVRGSLVRLDELRLGETRWAMQPGERFFRAALAGEMSGDLDHPVVSILQLSGIGINPQTNRRVQDLQVTGIDSSFAALWHDRIVIPGPDEVIVSENLAAKLNIQIGDRLLIRLPRAERAPQSAPFVADETPPASLLLTIVSVAGEEEMGRFSLKSNQRAPFNVFVSMEQLSSVIGLNRLANMLLVPGNANSDLTADRLNSALEHAWQMPDAGIRSELLDDKELFQLSTERIFFDDLTAGAIQRALPQVVPILTYLANTLAFNGKETPYSFVSAVNPGIIPVQPLPGEMIITDWLADDLGVRPGDSLSMTYFVMGPLRRLSERKAMFRVSAIIPLQEIPYGGAMMPDFPGMSDAGHCSDWETGVPVNLNRIRDKDEAYWNVNKGTPKAWISMEDGKRLWNNQFGAVTSFRFNSFSASSKTGCPASIRYPASDISSIRASVDSAIMAGIDPSWYRMVFQPVWEQGQLASANSIDFGGLFLSLSFFLIASSLLLTAMLFSLHAVTRIPEAGVLSGLGFRNRLIKRMLFMEALMVTVPGVILGSFGGVLYNKLIIIGLNTFWQDAVRTSMLRMEVNFSSLAIGAASGFILAASILYMVLRRQLGRTVAGRVKGIVVPENHRLKQSGWIWPVAGVMLFISSLAILALLLAGIIHPDADLFLAAGGMMMAGGICLMNYFLTLWSERPVFTRAGLLTLVLKIGSAKRTRSISAITLLALGTFTVVITGANRKTFYGSEQQRHSGTGGFLLWTETTMPLLYDLNTASGRSHYTLEDEDLLRDVRFFQLHRHDGNDASCLNLNQVPRPMMLGVSERDFDSLGAFSLINLLPETDPDHPWLTLGRELSSGVIPAFADQSVITWGLRKQIGDTLFYVDESGKELRVKLMGGLDNSIFQGHVLVSDSLLKLKYPSVSGTRIMLVDGPFGSRGEIAGRLEELFTDYGMAAVPASERLAEFNSVENTYLSVFMLLGALGVLIGTVGFGIILWRNILERQAEFALYLAIGYRKKLIRTMLMAEYMLVLVSGMFIGITGAAAGILPSLISPAYRMPGGFLFVAIAMIWISGALWIIIPVHLLLRSAGSLGIREE